MSGQRDVPQGTAVLRGALDPADCPLFCSRCTPASPVGPCMVSSEGSCAARYRYRGVATDGDDDATAGSRVGGAER